jgi:predicted amidohydrolase
VLGRIFAMLVQGCLGLGICKDTGIPEQQALAAELGMDVYVTGTLMFPDERGKQDDRALRIAKTHGVWVALASFAGPTGGGYAMSGGSSGIWGPDGVVQVQAGAAAGEVVSVTLG